MTLEDKLPPGELVVTFDGAADPDMVEAAVRAFGLAPYGENADNPQMCVEYRIAGLSEGSERTFADRIDDQYGKLVRFYRVGDEEFEGFY